MRAPTRQRPIWPVELTTDRGEAWRLLAFDAVVGHPPHVPWRPDERNAVGNLVERLAGVTAPPELPDAGAHATFDHWRRLLGDSAGLETYGEWAVRRLPWLAAREAGWAEAVRGDTLVHNDLRGDNVLLTSDGAGVVVDWPHAVRGAPFLDLVGWLPSLALEGGGAPQEVFDRHPVGRAADRRR